MRGSGRGAPVPGKRQERDLRRRPASMLVALESLLARPVTSLRTALDQACLQLSGLLGADKVDAFLFDPERDTLVAVGTSDTPLGRKQRALGLDRLPLSNGGQAVKAFRTGEPLHCNRVDEDDEEVPGIRDQLGVRSHIAAPLAGEGVSHGVLSATSKRRDFFDAQDLAFLQAASRWVGMVARQAELVEAVSRQALEQGRRLAAEELVTTLAHDMANLIAALRSRLELLEWRAEREAHEANQRDASQALLVLHRVHRLTADLLDVGRLDQGVFTLDKRAVNLGALAREVATLASNRERQVRVDGPEELVALVDASRVRQSLENLVANALKHTPPDAPVEVELRLQPRSGGPWALLAVQDHGPGIPEEMLPRLFERFVAGASSEGLGLGLYLARRIAQAHGGTLTVQSQPGTGARFELALPTREG